MLDELEKGPWPCFVKTDEAPAESAGVPLLCPLFIPLRREYFEAFKSGSKTEELRLYGSRWNERTCAPGRAVTLSKGYGKGNRLTGRIWKFKKQHGSTFGSTYKAAIQNCYGTLDVWIACISITDIKAQAHG